jgi:hypothetical protein
LNSAAIYFFCADEAQFESLNTNTAEEKISIVNNKIVKLTEYKTVRLLVNNKDQSKWTSHKLLLYKIIYILMLEINLLSTWILTEIGLRVVVDAAGSEIQSSENHELAVVNLILMNNLYFLNIVEDQPLQDSLIRAIAVKKSNHRQK